MDGHCSTKGDCMAGSECLNNMCICSNGASNYPVCGETEGANSCGEKCGKNQFCSRKFQRCMCIFGGLPGNCCQTKCGDFQSCLDGRCFCMYGKNSKRQCKRCS